MRSRRFWWTAAAIWLLFGLIAGVQVWISMITHGHSVPLLLTYYVLIWMAWLPITVAIVWLAARFPVFPPKRFPVMVHALAAMVFAVIHVRYWIALLVLMKPFDVMTAPVEKIHFASILLSHVPLEILLYAAVLGTVQAADYYEKYRAAQSSLNAARLHALELQLQPHFLFNTLNSVSALVRVGRTDDAVKMIAVLSDLLRYTLDRSGAQRVAFAEEVSTLRRYFEIQRMRFPDRLTLQIDVPDELADAEVPTFILQPLAENAVRHGVSRSAGEGRVELRAFRENGFLKIEMFNTGSMDPNAARGVGLTNTANRLQQMYGSNHRFSVHAERGGVVAAITIPWSVAA